MYMCVCMCEDVCVLCVCVLCLCMDCLCICVLACVVYELCVCMSVCVSVCVVVGMHSTILLYQCMHPGMQRLMQYLYEQV